MPDVATSMLMLLAVFSATVMVAFAPGMYAVFRMQDPPLSPFQSIVTIAVIFTLAYAVLNTKSCQTFFNHAGEEASES